MDRKCIKCKREIIDKRYFLKHIANCSIGVSKPLKCVQCPQRFNLEQKLNAHIQRDHRLPNIPTSLSIAKFAPLLRQSIQSSKDYRALDSVIYLINEFDQSFAEFSSKEEVHFIYILLDPLILRNLLVLRKHLTKVVVWERFLRSIFFVGTHSRQKDDCSTYSYLKEAVNSYNRPPEADRCMEKQLQRILSIWQKKHGVVCLELFEATSWLLTCSRQAAIVQTLGTAQLANTDEGMFYTPSEEWDLEKMFQLGTALLHKAHLFYLEGDNNEVLPWNVIYDKECHIATYEEKIN